MENKIKKKTKKRTEGCNALTNWRRNKNNFRRPCADGNND